MNPIIGCISYLPKFAFNIGYSVHVASKRTPMELIYVGRANILEFDPINLLGLWSNLWTIRDLSRGLASLPVRISLMVTLVELDNLEESTS